MANQPLTARERFRAAYIGAALKIAGDKEAGIHCIRAAMTGQWEGGEPSRYRNRPGKRLTAQDTDLNWGRREDIISESRNLEQTFPLARRIKSKFVDYCYGKGKIKWNTGSRDLNALYEANYESFKARADVNAQHTFPKLTKLAIGSTITDGDHFGQLINVNGHGMIRCIEADRVSSAGNFNNDTPQMIGGIGLDGNGRPAFIRVWNRTIYGTFDTSVDIPKKDYVHLWDSKRVDAYRSVPAYVTCLNPMRDFKEGSQAEMIAIKRNSKLALIHKVITGQAQRPINLTGDDVAPDSPAGVTMREVNDGVDEYMFPTEDVKPHEFNRPGNQWLPFMEFVVQQIAIGVDLPFSVLWHMAGLGKPAILADLKAAQRTFDSFMEELEWKWIRPIVGFETALAIQSKRLPFTPNWWKFLVGRPEPITIDAGRDSAAAINENKMAMRSLRSWFLESEEDWEEELEQCIVERSYFEERCKFHKVDPNNVRMMTANGNAPDANSSEPDDDEPQKPNKPQKEEVPA